MDRKLIPAVGNRDRRPLQSPYAEMMDSSPRENTDTHTASVSAATSVLEQIYRHDEDAWSMVMYMYWPVVWSWCRNAGLQDQDATGVCRQVFQALSENIESFRRDLSSKSFRMWVWRITQDRIEFFLRTTSPGECSSAHRQVFHPMVGESSVSEPTATAHRDEAVLLRRALDLIESEFDHRTFQAFWKVAIDGHTAGDVGGQLGMGKGAVYVAKIRVLRRLKEFCDLL